MDKDKSIRVILEEREHSILSPYACFSDQSKGREFAEEPCDIRPCFQRDRDRILHSKAFRRLKDKTQVFLTPEKDHYRTRMTHTLEVSQIARSIAKSLMLNEDLTEAIALGHDLGHTPFGHAGERALNSVNPNGFKHHIQSLRVVQFLEKRGKGLNLSYEVLDGIKNHQTTGNPETLCGKIVQMSDKIAYVNHDIDDAIRGNIIREEDIPREFTDLLGHGLKERLNSVIHDVVTNSYGKNYVEMTPTFKEAMVGLRKWLFENVYTNPTAKGEEGKAESMVKNLYEYYMTHPHMIPGEYHENIIQRGESIEYAVCDYIAGMSDRYFVSVYQDIMIPKAWKL